MTEFSNDSLWAQRDVADPLAERVSIEGLTYVAFLYDPPDAGGAYGLDVQGLAVSCAGSAEPAIPIIEPLPVDAAVLSVDALAAAVSSLADPE